MNKGKPGNPVQKGNNDKKKKFESPFYEQKMIDQMESEILKGNTNVCWDDIADLDKAKQLLTEAAILPIIKPNFFGGIRQPWAGILLTGPPGTGKSLLAKALATECQATFFSISSSSLASKWRGDSETLVKLLFDMANFYAPSIIFIDEVDSLCSKRGGDESSDSSRKVQSEILSRMDGFGNSDDGKRVMILCATNFPWDLDEAFKRRLQKRIFIPLPTAKGRQQMLKINLKDVGTDDDVDLGLIAHKLEGYSGADITTVCRDAAMMGIRDLMNGIKDIREIRKLKGEKIRPISMNDFNVAIDNNKSSVCQEDVDKIRKWIEESGAK